MSIVPVKIRIDTRHLTRNLARIRDRFHAEVRDSVEAIVVDGLIRGGTSPVEGWGRYKAYSASYSNQMGFTKTAKVSAKTGRLVVGGFKGKGGGTVKGTDGAKYNNKKPGKVNLTVSGTMLDSLKVSVLKDRIKIFFTSPFAAYHNDGIPSKAGLVRRPLLPSKSGETFSRTVMRYLNKAAASSVDKELKNK